MGGNLKGKSLKPEDLIAAKSLIESQPKCAYTTPILLRTAIKVSILKIFGRYRGVRIRWYKGG